MLAPAGQASGSRISAVGGDEADVSNRESSGNKESLDRNPDTKASLGHAPTNAPTMTNRSLPYSTNDTSTVPTKGVVNRSLPDYIVDRKIPRNEAAHKIWQADALSCDPCAICKALKIDCWVDGEYSRCARCTASPQYEGICNAIGTKDAHQDLDEPSSLGTGVGGRGHKLAIDDELSAVQSISVPSGLAEKNQKLPQELSSTVANRSLPDYIQWPGEKRKDRSKVAYNIWAAGDLSSNPCRTCKKLEAECWVNADYKRCARCTMSNGGRSGDCNAAGTRDSVEIVV